MLVSIHHMDQTLISTAWHVTAMLERLSADSVWAHRASGLRGSLLKALADLDTRQATSIEMSELNRLVQIGFEILEKAAREIRE
jgi:hypothetical protein